MGIYMDSAIGGWGIEGWGMGLYMASGTVPL